MRLLRTGASVLFIGLLLHAAALERLHAATLERLTLDEMTRKSTAIVRARVISSYAAPRGSLIYTHYIVEVLEQWKGSAVARLDVVSPGGALSGVRQTFSGAPRMAAGSEYVLFLWTGSSGLTHIIGLSQGLFDVSRDGDGEIVVSRGASSEVMLDPATGRVMRDVPVTLRLRDLRQRVGATLAQGGRR